MRTALELLAALTRAKRNLDSRIATLAAQGSFGHLGRAVLIHPSVQYTNPRRIHISDHCQLGKSVSLLSEPGDGVNLIVGNNVRIGNNACLRAFKGQIVLGDNVTVERNCTIHAGMGRIEIGDYVQIGEGTCLDAGGGMIRIGSKSQVGKNCILSAIGGQLLLGKQARIGHYVILDASGGRIVAEDKVSIDERNTIYGKGGVTLGAGTHFWPDNYVAAFQNEFIFGYDTTLGQKCIVAGRGKIEIGDYAMIGGLTFIISENHIHKSIKTHIKFQGHTAEGIVVEEGAWIGGCSMILDGVVIGERTMVGGGSVVTKSIPSHMMAYGVPARIVRKREEAE